MEKIKVLEVCYSLKAAGIETFVANLFEKLDKNRFSVDFLITNNNETDFFYRDKIEQLGGRIIDASAKGPFFIKRIKQFRNKSKAASQNKYDVIHIHASSGVQGYDCKWAAKANPRKIVVHSHAYSESTKEFFSGKEHPYIKRILHHYGKKIIKKVCYRQSSLFNRSRQMVV